jgi:hypothetical protein
MNTDHLVQFATQRQLDYLEAVKSCGSQQKAALRLGVSRRTLDQSLKSLREKAAKTLISEHANTEKVPEGFGIVGTTTLQKAGKQVMQWVRTSATKEAEFANMRAFVEAMCSEITPEEQVLTLPCILAPDLCNLYTFTDYHLGMLAWEKEGGAPWNLEVAEKMLWQGFQRMVDASPAADNCVINIQGDFLHSDGLLPVTPKNHHVLDSAGRFPQIVDVAIRVLRKLISHALKKHLFVTLIIVEGNHDEASSMWLRKMFSALYEEEPRLKVNDSELPFYIHQHGDIMLAFHHGHKANNEQLPMLFAAQFPKAWGDTTKRYCHTGHRHHLDEKEYAGMTVTQHPTLSARDAYAARGGWISERSAMGITYHAKAGQVGRVFISPELMG